MPLLCAALYLNAFCFVYDCETLQATILGLFVGENLHRAHYALADSNPTDAVSNRLHYTSGGATEDGRVLKTENSKLGNFGVRWLNCACLDLPEPLSSM